MQRLQTAKVVFIGALALIFVSTAALAENDGLFLSGAVNYGQIDDDFGFFDGDAGDGDNIDAFFDDKSVGVNVGAGWRINSWLAIDAAYWDFGEFKSDEFGEGRDTKLDTTAITAGAMFSVPLWILDVYARGGAAYWDAESREVGDDGTDLYYGVGAALNVFGSIDLYMEVVRFDLLTELDTASLGIRLTF